MHEEHGAPFTDFPFKNTRKRSLFLYYSGLTTARGNAPFVLQQKSDSRAPARG